MNKAIFIGNLSRDPELSETKSGKTVCKFGIAVPREKSKEVDFFNVTAWENLAEIVNKYAHKGDKVCVVGTLQIRSYEDSNGVTKTTCEIIASEVEFLGTNKKRSYDNGEREERVDAKPTRRSSYGDDDGSIPI